jgi:hypothetical protein
MACLALNASPMLAQEPPDEQKTPPEVYIGEGVRAFQQQKFARAEEMFTRALAKIPNSVEVYYNRATVRYFLNNERGMMSDLYSAAKICASCLRGSMKTDLKDAQLPLAFTELHGLGHYILGDYGRADTLLHRAQMLGSTRSLTQLYAGLSVAQLGTQAVKPDATSRGCAECELAAMRGEVLLYPALAVPDDRKPFDATALPALQDTVNTLCGGRIADDKRFTMLYSAADPLLLGQAASENATKTNDTQKSVESFTASANAAQTTVPPVYLFNFPRPRQFFARGVKSSQAAAQASAQTSAQASVQAGSQPDTTGIAITGFVTLPLLRYDSVVVEVRRTATTTTTTERSAAALNYRTFKDINGTVIATAASFSLPITLYAEFSEHTVRVMLKNSLGARIGGSTSERLLAESDSIVCGDVFMIGGQSNSVGTHAINPANDAALKRIFASPKREFLRTYVQHKSGAGWAFAEETHKHFEFPTAHGTPHNRAGIIGSALGMELLERSGNVPVCIVQSTVQGAERLSETLPKSEPVMTGHFSDNAHQQVRVRLLAAGLMDNVKGWVWYQGEADSAGRFDFRFTGLYDAWRDQLPLLKNGTGKAYLIQARPAYCGGAAIPSQAALREMQREFGRIFRNTEVLAAASPLGVGVGVGIGIGGTNGCVPDDASYAQLGKQLADLIVRDLYGSGGQSAKADTVGISSPVIQRATLQSAQAGQSAQAAKASASKSSAPLTEIVLDFTSNKAPASLVATPDLAFIVNKKTFPQTIADAFFITTAPAKKADDPSASVDVFRVFKSARVEGSKVILQLKAPLPASVVLQGVSYLPSQFYAGTSIPYNGPWLTTTRGVGALAFYRFAVQTVR